MTLFAKAIAWYEEYAFLQGNGTGKPQGMLDRRRRGHRHRAAAANLVQFADLARMWSKLLPVVVEQGHLGFLARRSCRSCCS